VPFLPQAIEVGEQQKDVSLIAHASQVLADVLLGTEQHQEGVMRLRQSYEATRRQLDAVWEALALQKAAPHLWEEGRHLDTILALGRASWIASRIKIATAEHIVQELAHARATTLRAVENFEAQTSEIPEEPLHASFHRGVINLVDGCLEQAREELTRARDTARQHNLADSATATTLLELIEAAEQSSDPMATFWDLLPKRVDLMPTVEETEQVELSTSPLAQLIREKDEEKLRKAAKTMAEPMKFDAGAQLIKGFSDGAKQIEYRACILWLLGSNLGQLEGQGRDKAIKALITTATELLHANPDDDSRLVILDGMARAMLAASVKGNAELIRFLRDHQEELKKYRVSAAVRAALVVIV
jgi:hypothetical protein